MGNELERSKTWFNRGKTYRAKSLESLKQLYSAGIHATLETQPETTWEQLTAQDVQPGSEPKGIDHASRAKPMAKKKRKQAQQSAEGSSEPR